MADGSEPPTHIGPTWWHWLPCPALEDGYVWLSLGAWYCC